MQRARSHDADRRRERTNLTTGVRDAEGTVPPRVAEPPESAVRQKRRLRDRLGAARSARSRILIAYVVLLAIALVVALLGFRQFLLIRLEDEVHNDLRQE